MNKSLAYVPVPIPTRNLAIIMAPYLACLRFPIVDGTNEMAE